MQLIGYLCWQCRVVKQWVNTVRTHYFHLFFIYLNLTHPIIVWHKDREFSLLGAGEKKWRNISDWLIKARLPCLYSLPIRKKKKKNWNLVGPSNMDTWMKKFNAERQAFSLVDHARFRMRTSLPLLDCAPYHHHH